MGVHDLIASWILTCSCEKNGGIHHVLADMLYPKNFSLVDSGEWSESQEFGPVRTLGIEDHKKITLIDQQSLGICRTEFIVHLYSFRLSFLCTTTPKSVKINLQNKPCENVTKILIHCNFLFAEDRHCGANKKRSIQASCTSNEQQRKFRSNYTRNSSPKVIR